MGFYNNQILSRTNDDAELDRRDDLASSAATPALRQVKWSNVWNWTHSGGHGSRVHLTADAGLSGATLCGKEFPRMKGHPIGVYVCKRCLQKSGITVAALSKLAYVPSGDE